MPGNRLTSSNADSDSSLEASCRIETLRAEHTSSAPRSMRLGRYRLVCELASGGMAAVNLAFAQGLDKLLALKVIHPHLAKHESFIAMFLDEARIASSVLHPNVCNVFDYGEHDGHYYMAMDYLAGCTLREVMRRLRDSSVPPAEDVHALMAFVIAQACRGLHAAHELRGMRGDLLEVVHRDVSPHNLLVTYDGHVSVIDFGIARAADRLQQTAAGVLKGKFSYMAPEQLRQLEVDRRADVWALGVCLWEALTRRRLFARPTQADTLMSVTSGEIPPPSQLDSSVPPALDAIVMRALSRTVEARYATARELGRDLMEACRQAGLSNEPVELEQLMAGLFAEEITLARGLEQHAKQLAAQERGSHLTSCAPAQPGVVVQLRAQRPCSSVSSLAVLGAEDAVTLPGAEARATPVPFAKPRRTLSWRTASLLAAAAVAGLCLLWTHGQDPGSAAATPGASVLAGREAPSFARRPSAPAPRRPIGEASAIELRADDGPPASQGAVANHVPAAARVAAQRASPARRVSDVRSARLPAARAARMEERPTEPQVLPAPGPQPQAEPMLAADVAFRAVRTAGSLVPSVVARMLARAAPLVRDCYLEALDRKERVPARAPLWFSIDEGGAVKDGGMGAQALPPLAACVVETLRRVRSDQPPEAGVVSVAAELEFRAVDLRGALEQR